MLYEVITNGGVGAVVVMQRAKSKTPGPTDFAADVVAEAIVEFQEWLDLGRLIGHDLKDRQLRERHHAAPARLPVVRRSRSAG